MEVRHDQDSACSLGPGVIAGAAWHCEGELVGVIVAVQSNILLQAADVNREHVAEIRISADVHFPCPPDAWPPPLGGGYKMRTQPPMGL
jgi:hypothetical protein